MTKSVDRTHFTPDQERAEEKREAAQKRSDAALKASADQEWPPVPGVVPNPGDEPVKAPQKAEKAEPAARTEPPKGRRGKSQQKA